MISLGSPSFDSQAREFSRYRLMMMIEGLRERDRGGGGDLRGDEKHSSCRSGSDGFDFDRSVVGCV